MSYIWLIFVFLLESPGIEGELTSWGKHWSRETSPGGEKQVLQSRPSNSAVRTPLSPTLLRPVSVSPAATRAVCVIWLTPFLCLFPSFHSPSLAGSLSLRLPRSLARSERVLGGRSAAAFSTGHPAPRAALAPPRPPLPAAAASGCAVLGKGLI